VPNTGPRFVGWPTEYNTRRKTLGRSRGLGNTWGVLPCSRATNRPAPAGLNTVTCHAMDDCGSRTINLLGFVRLWSGISDSNDLSP